ncbi:hypothetical protein JCM10213_003858 [Rhodosporidiobolus nylandii]
MPFEPVVNHEELDHSYRLRYSCDIDFDITDVDLDFSHFLRGFPFAGKWTLLLGRDPRDIQNLQISLKNRKPAKGSSQQRWQSGIELHWLKADGAAYPITSASGVSSEGVFDGVICQIGAFWWGNAAQADGGYQPATHRSYRVVLSFEQDYPTKESREFRKDAQELARRTAGLNLEQIPHDVRLFFPRTQADGAELWVKGDILSRSSPYLKDLLSSDFAEAQPRRSKRARTSGAVEAAPAPTPAEKDFEDSDDETDEFLFSTKPPSLSSSSEVDDISFPFRQITVTQTAFSTYHAVLVYIQTGFVHFTPLSSSFPLSNPAFSTRRNFLSSKHDEDPSLPLPVSPTSAYRLAHLLQLEDLQKCALEAVQKSLTVKGAAAELFRDTSIAYEDFRKVVLDYVKAKWTKVKESEGWKAKMAEIEAGELSQAAPVLLELWKAGLQA